MFGDVARLVAHRRAATLTSGPPVCRPELSGHTYRRLGSCPEADGALTASVSESDLCARLAVTITGPRLITTITGPRLITTITGPRLITTITGPRLITTITGPRLVTPPSAARYSWSARQQPCHPEAEGDGPSRHIGRRRIYKRPLPATPGRGLTVHSLRTAVAARRPQPQQSSLARRRRATRLNAS